MKRTLFISILIIFIISLVGCNNQTPTKELYQLQEQCGKGSQEWFKKKYGNEDKPSLSYQSHYNKKMTKCFVVITEDRVNKLDNKPYYRKSLWDINENKEYGFIHMTKTETTCFLIVTKKECKNSVEWDELVEPYMKE